MKNLNELGLVELANNENLKIIGGEGSIPWWLKPLEDWLLGN